MWQRSWWWHGQFGGRSGPADIKSRDPHLAGGEQFVSLSRDGRFTREVWPLNDGQKGWPFEPAYCRQIYTFLFIRVIESNSRWWGRFQAAAAMYEVYPPANKGSSGSSSWRLSGTGSFEVCCPMFVPLCTLKLHMNKIQLPSFFWLVCQVLPQHLDMSEGTMPNLWPG